MTALEHYAEALRLAAGDRLEVLAALLELVHLRELHAAAQGILGVRGGRHPRRFIGLLEALPAPSDAAYWRRLAARLDADAHVGMSAPLEGGDRS